MHQLLRQRPPINSDNAFFFKALEEDKLVAQQCSNCGLFRHPPVPCCPKCQSFEWQATEIQGHGQLLSYTVIHHPVVRPFQKGYIVGLVALEHGVHMVMNLEFPENKAEIGMSIEVRPHRYDDELVLMAGFYQGQDFDGVPLSETEREH